ncbi:MAG: D-glycero-beta-D-manno-heptose 1-phosphate adenylyltransferase [candidate division Zixibacteria bacterium]|nr:D-glycero-beta-D-manno-heptose 1-phosphate adenylyltransferase [candidate division Zixibacteria bacterium]
MKAAAPVSKKNLPALLKKLKKQRQRVVFTNGVFDIIHRGHIDYLYKARSFGDILIVGLNSDSSVRRLKGNKRPLQKQADRAAIVVSLKPVDYVVLFGEDTPERLIETIRPDILVKGADYKVREIVGARFVKSYGGKVRRVRLSAGRSSSNLIKRLS